MSRITLFNLEYNIYNGLVIDLLYLDIGSWEAGLFHLNISDRVYLDICFISMQFRLPRLIFIRNLIKRYTDE